MLDLPFWKPVIYVLVKHAISKTITLFSKNLVSPWQSLSFPHIIHTFLLTKNHKPSFQFSHLFTVPTQPFSFLKTSENQAVLFFELLNFLTVNDLSGPSNMGSFLSLINHTSKHKRCCWMGTLQYCSGSIPSLLKHRVVDSSTSSSSEKRLESGPGFSRVVMAGSDSDNFSKPKIATGSSGYVLEDVPHLSDYIPDLPVRRRFSVSLLINSAVINWFCFNIIILLLLLFLLFSVWLLRKR